MTSAAKTFDPRVIGSITSGVLLIKPFGDVHEAIEFLAGHPVWTHELPTIARALTAGLVAQYPDLPTKETVGDWQECAERLLGQFPSGIELERGTMERSADPVTTLARAIGDR